MFRRKTLKRLTRFGLCFYVFSYIMALTVCAEEFPLVGGTDASYGIPVVESAFEDATDTERGLVVENIETGEEPEVLEAASVEPDPDEVEYNGSSIYRSGGLWWQIWPNVKDSTDYSDTKYSVRLTKDVTLNDEDPSQLVSYDSRVGEVTINGDGHAIHGSNSVVKQTDLRDFKAFHYLTFKNTVFKDFNRGIFVDNWPDIGTKKNTFNFINCTFEGNTGGSGTVFYSVQTDYVTFTNCTFKNNDASGSGGVIYLDYSGTLKLDGCTFINNTANENGGAIAIVNASRSLEIDECRFENNAAGLQGGAVYDKIDSSSGSNRYSVSRSQFLSNKANTPDVSGGAIYRHTVNPSKDVISSSAFIKNTEPEIVLGQLYDEENIGDFISGNWFGGTVDQAMKNQSTEPSILLCSGDITGLYYWKLLNMEREGSGYSKLLRFEVYAASNCYSNGTVEYLGPKYGISAGIDFVGAGENITFTNGTARINKEGEYYRGTLLASINPGSKTYSVSVKDPMGNVLITRSYDRTIEKWGVSFENATDGTEYRDRWGFAIEGDILTFSAYGNYWSTSDNGTLMRYIDYNNATGEEVVYGTSGAGPALAGETIHVYVDGKKIGDYFPDSKGLFNINASELGKFGYVNINFTVDFTSEQASQQKRVLPKGYTEVSTSSYEPNTLRISLSSPTKNITEGTLSVYYNTTTDGTRKLLDSWDITGVGNTSFVKTVENLNESLPAGLYYFTAEYTCDSGNFKNSTEPFYAGSKSSTLVGPEGFTATDLIPGSSKNTLEACMFGVGNVTNGNVSVWYRPAAGGEKTFLEKWDVENYDNAWYNDGKFSLYGYLNVSSIPDGDYVFIVEYNCPDGSYTNATCEKNITLPIEPVYPEDLDDAGVSFADGNSLTKIVSDEDFFLNVTAANPGKGTGTWKFSSSNESVAIVNDEGKVSLIAPGITDIIAEYSATGCYGKAVLVLTVKDTDLDPAGVAFADGEELEKTIGDPDFTLNVTAAAQGSGGTWGFESSNESVATIDDKGLVSLKAVGSTDIIATYKSSTTFGKATLLLIVKPAGNGTDPKNNSAAQPGIVDDSGNLVPIIINSTIIYNNITVNYINNTIIVYNIQYTDTAYFTGGSFKQKDVKEIGNGIYDICGVRVKLDTSITNFSTPNFKFKNVKHATVNNKNKKAYFTVSYKANSGATKDEKKQVKAVNKEVKKLKNEFVIEQADLSMADPDQSSVTMNGKGDKVKKATVSISGNSLILKKKDFDVENISDTNVTLKGKGDYKNSVTIKK